MRWLLLLSLASLPFGSLAAKKSAEARFDKYHTKAQASTPIKLDDAKYKELTVAPRDYTAVVLLTAMDSRFGCQLCHQFEPEWDLLSKTWTKGDRKGAARTLFSTLDFIDGRDTFMSLGLQTAPVLLLFPPTTGPHAVTSQDPVRFDFSGGPQTAEQVHDWVKRHLPDRPHPRLTRPVNYTLWAATIMAGLVIVGVVYRLWGIIGPFLQSRNLWASISVIAVLLFTSGHMFNQIRHSPYVTSDGKGGITYFAGGFQNQLAIETQIIGFLYGLLAICSVALVTKAPRIADSRTQSLFVVVTSFVMLITYSYLLSVFRIKNAGYPFSLPPFL